ncbi:MAG: lycopene cyclase domain-containing protein [Propionibacteriaceae bacterium]
MTGYLYLLCGLVSLAGMILLDLRWRLFLFADARRGIPVLVVGAGLLLLVDLVAIRHDFYRRGEGPFLSGVEIVPHLPIEEIVFVVFLCQLTMVLHALVARWVERGRP